MTYLLGLLVFALSVAIVVWLRRSRRDEMFAGITPGLSPASGQPEVRVRVTKAGSPPIAVRFDPPSGLRPALAGVIVESRLDTVAISATLVDLAVRGWLTMRPIEPDEGGSTRAKDWELRASDTVPAEQLSPAERELVSALFVAGPVTTLHEFRSQGTALSRTLTAFGDEVQARNWFLPPPAVSLAGVGAGAAALGFLLLIFAGSVAPVGLGLLLGGVVAILASRGLPQPVSAEGYAARTQALGFTQYLATAEAEQLRFEVGIEQFSRYLPWAMVFGVVDHWRHVFAGALQEELDAGGEFTGFGWLALNDVLTTMVLVDLLTDGGLLDGFVGDFGGFGDGGFGADGIDAGGDGGDPGGGDGSDAGSGEGWGGFGGDSGGFDGGGFDGGGFGE
ncbi:MAG: DUF2207 family protein [Propionicimonas sp.]